MQVSADVDRFVTARKSYSGIGAMKTAGGERSSHSALRSGKRMCPISEDSMMQISVPSMDGQVLVPDGSGK